VGSKLTHLAPNGTASIVIASGVVEGGRVIIDKTKTVKKYVDVYFCNNDIAFSTSWGMGTNTRNMTLTVNSVTTRVELPLSGKSSELFSQGKGWQDTGVFGVLLDGWIDGENKVVVGNAYGDQGLVTYGADLVGLGVYW